MGKVGMLLDAAYTALLEGVSQAEAADSIRLKTVYELPQGRRVGWWARECGETPAGGWLATPSEVSTEKCRWEIEGEGGPGVVVEVLCATEVAEAGGAAAVRVPGWACGGLRSGAPAGLLVARLAEEAKRRGLPLWIPNLDDEGLRYALGLPGRLWVDGSAVPSSEEG
jgi:hypothetical protein